MFFPPDMAVGNGRGDAEGCSYVGHALCVSQGVVMVVRSQERMDICVMPQIIETVALHIHYKVLAFLRVGTEYNIQLCLALYE